MNAVSAPYWLMFSWCVWSKGEMRADTRMMTLTPSTTPNTVSALRSLCVRKGSSACLRFSLYAWAILCSSPVRAQSFDGIQLGRLHGRKDSEKETHSGRDAKRQNHHRQRSLHCEFKQRLHQEHQRISS